MRAFFRCSIDWNPFCSGVCNIRHPSWKNQSHKILNHEPCQKALVPIVLCFRRSPRRSCLLIFPAHHWLQGCAMWYRRFPSCTRDSRRTKTSHSVASDCFDGLYSMVLGSKGFWEQIHIPYQPALLSRWFWTSFPVWWDILVPWRVFLAVLPHSGMVTTKRRLRHILNGIPSWMGSQADWFVFLLSGEVPRNSS